MEAAGTSGVREASDRWQSPLSGPCGLMRRRTGVLLRHHWPCPRHWFNTRDISKAARVKAPTFTHSPGDTSMPAGHLACPPLLAEMKLRVGLDSHALKPRK